MTGVRLRGNDGSDVVRRLIGELFQQSGCFTLHTITTEYARAIRQGIADAVQKLGSMLYTGGADNLGLTLRIDLATEADAWGQCDEPQRIITALLRNCMSRRSPRHLFLVLPMGMHGRTAAR